MKKPKAIARLSKLIWLSFVVRECVKFAGGVLLAIGPLVIAVSLFDGLLGVTGAWVRGLIGVIVAGVASRLAVAFQMAFLREAVVSRATATQLPLLDPGLGPTAVIFLTLNLVVVLVAFLSAGRLRWPRPDNGVTVDLPVAQRTSESRTLRTAQHESLTTRSRARTTADAIQRTMLAENATAVVGARTGAAGDRALSCCEGVPRDAGICGQGRDLQLRRRRCPRR